MIQSHCIIRKQFFLFHSIEKRRSSEILFVGIRSYFPMDENYLTAILDCTEQCCKLLLCSQWFVHLVLSSIDFPSFLVTHFHEKSSLLMGKIQSFVCKSFSNQLFIIVVLSEDHVQRNNILVEKLLISLPFISIRNTMEFSLYSIEHFDHYVN